MVTTSPPRIGILALQGDVEPHRQVLARLRATTVSVKVPTDLDRLSGLILPGGESTTIGLLLRERGLDRAIREHVEHHGLAVMGTCAGLILLAKGVKETPDQPRLALLDIIVQRNAYGRQRESCEALVEVPRLGPQPLHALFIRAPVVVETGPSVTVLSRWHDQIVLVQQDAILASTFHPELTGDDRLHRYFLSEIVAPPA